MLDLRRRQFIMLLGDENIRCLPIAHSAPKTITKLGRVVVRDVDAIGRTRPNPRLVVVIVAAEAVDLGEAAGQGR